MSVYRGEVELRLFPGVWTQVPGTKIELLWTGHTEEKVYQVHGRWQVPPDRCFARRVAKPAHVPEPEPEPEPVIVEVRTCPVCGFPIPPKSITIT